MRPGEYVPILIGLVVGAVLAIVEATCGWDPVQGGSPRLLQLLAAYRVVWVLCGALIMFGFFRWWWRVVTKMMICARRPFRSRD
jgi:hypothetical protein